MNPLNIAKALKEKRAKATQEEWLIEKIGDVSYDEERIIVHDGKSGFGDDIICDIDADKPEAKENSEFITFAANHSTTLADAFIELVEALKEIAEGRHDGHNWESAKAREVLRKWRLND